MRKLLTSALAAVTAAAAVAAVATPAQAERYRHRNRDNNDAAAAAVIGGIVGLALGAAIAGSNKDRRDDGYYRQGYYDNGYYRGGYGYGDDGYYRGYSGRAYAYDYGPRVCVSRERVYDPYYGRRVTIERRYAC